MNFLSKKGQTEDILADLIPAIVIMIIAIYLLSSISSTHETNIDERMIELNSKLESKADFLTLLRMHPIKAYPDDKEVQELLCSNPRLSTADIIAKIDPKKARAAQDPCYSNLISIIDDFNQILTRENCMMLKLNFPSENIDLELPSATCALSALKQKQEKEFLLPSKTGDYVNITVLTEQ